VALIGESKLGCYLRERHIGFDQQPFGTFDPQLYDVLVRRHPRGSLELSMEVKGAQSDGGGEMHEVNRSIDMSSDQIKDLTQFVRRHALPRGQRSASRSCAGWTTGSRKLTGVHLCAPVAASAAGHGDYWTR
jgi:hypothetical protein